jgi:hypothetical protein
MALISAMSATWPYRLTGMMALVRGVTLASISPASMLQVSGSMSTNTGLAPSSTITSAVAAKVKGVVMTSSPRQAQRHQRDQQRLGAAGHGHMQCGAGEARPALLQLGHLRAHDVLAVVQHALDARVDAALERGVLASSGR